MTEMELSRMMLYYDQIDAMTTKWPLMGGPCYPITISLIYLFVVYYLLPFYMSNKHPYRLSKVTKVYNIILILVNIIMVFRLFSTDITWDLAMGRFVDNGERELDTAINCWWIVMIKFFEMFETCFFVLRKKFTQASPLHVYHHVSTFLLIWITCYLRSGKFLAIPMFLNTSVHVVMYAYYFATSCGPEWKKLVQPYKTTITQLQLVQLVAIFLYSVRLYLWTPECPMIILLLTMPNVLINIWNFGHFYVKTYRRRV